MVIFLIQAKNDRRLYNTAPEFISEHIGLGYIASCLEKGGFSVKLIDCLVVEKKFDDLVEDVAKENPLMVGFSVSNFNLVNTINICRAIRKRGYKGHITVGGYLPTPLSETFLKDFPFIDSVIRGEGEETVVELAKTLAEEGKLEKIRGLTFRDRERVYVNEPRPALVNLDSLPFPRRTFIGNVAAITMSRGCHLNCGYCIAKHWRSENPGKPWRHRSPESVVDEIEELVNKNNVKSFRFTDPTFIGAGKEGKEVVRKFAEEIISRKLEISYSVMCNPWDINKENLELLHLLKRSGLKVVLMGVDILNEEESKFYRRPPSSRFISGAVYLLEKVGIKPIFNFFMFHPFSTVEELKENIKFLESYIDYALLPFSWASKMEPFPGTEIYKILDIKSPYELEYEFQDKAVSEIYNLTQEFLELIFELPPNFLSNTVMGMIQLDTVMAIVDSIRLGIKKDAERAIKSSVRFLRELSLKED